MVVSSDGHIQRYYRPAGQDLGGLLEGSDLALYGRIQRYLLDEVTTVQGLKKRANTFQSGLSSGIPGGKLHQSLQASTILQGLQKGGLNQPSPIPNSPPNFDVLNNATGDKKILGPGPLRGSSIYLYMALEKLR